MGYMIREGLSRTCFTDFLDMHRHSTIDTKSLARDITSFWQTEKTDGSCDFIGGTKASQWGVLEHEFALLFCDAGREFLRYKTRSNTIAVNFSNGHFTSRAQN